MILPPFRLRAGNGLAVSDTESSRYDRFIPVMGVSGLPTEPSRPGVGLIRLFPRPRLRARLGAGSGIGDGGCGIGKSCARRLMFACAAIAAALRPVLIGAAVGSTWAGMSPFGPTGLTRVRCVFCGSRSGRMIPRRARVARFFRFKSLSLSFSR